MIFDIPGTGKITIENVLLDYNGTLAVDGRLLKGVKEKINVLAQTVSVHVITADTFGSVEDALNGTPCKVVVIPKQNQDQAKLDYLRQLGPEKTLCAGNGVNDRLMLKEAALGIAVLLEEGTAVCALTAADILVSHILDAFAYFEKPDRLVACLRN